MIKTITSRLACMALLLVASASALAQPAQKRLALLIGNSAYQNTTKLGSPSKDVDDMAQVLGEAGFEVIKVKDATKKVIKEQVNTFTNRLKDYEVGMFYYSGHGVEVDGVNYIVPIDLSKITSTTSKYDIEEECIPSLFINNKMSLAGELNKTYIIVLDACRNSPFKGMKSLHKDIGDSDTWLQPRDAPSGSIVCYAASGGQTAADGGLKNSPYTACFIKHLRTKGILIEEVFKRVRVELRDTEAQIPQELSTLSTNFYFFGLSTSTPSTTTPNTTTTLPVKVARPADRDLDGVADTEDRCPDNYGIATNRGCPDESTGNTDYDNDGLTDDEDACPTEAGTKSTSGCPDADGDGVPDKADKCLNAKGDARWEGCPDTDGDGIPDHKDSCIKERGTSLYSGCPPPAAMPTETSNQMLRAAGEKFLTTNKTRPGVITTASGLQYEIIKAGTGTIPNANNTVRCHYRGVLTTGEQFDSSYDRNKPADLPVNGVIQGWVEALQLMPTGSKWKLYIPYNLAYGEAGNSRAKIPSYSVLIFDVELLEIVK